MTSIDISSPSFIQKLKQGDQKMFDYLYDHYAPNLLGVVQTIVPATDVAEDVLQKAFVKIWKNIDQYDVNRGTFFTWMLNICRNLAIDEYRKADRARKKVIQSQKDNVDRVEKTSEFSIDEQPHLMKNNKLYEAINQLPDDQKYVIEQLFLGGLTQKELGTADDIPLGTIKSRVRLALNKLRNHLKLILFWI